MTPKLTSCQQINVAVSWGWIHIHAVSVLSLTLTDVRFTVFSFQLSSPLRRLYWNGILWSFTKDVMATSSWGCYSLGIRDSNSSDWAHSCFKIHLKSFEQRKTISKPVYSFIEINYRHFPLKLHSNQRAVFKETVLTIDFNNSRVTAFDLVHSKNLAFGEPQNIRLNVLPLKCMTPTPAE